MDLKEGMFISFIFNGGQKGVGRVFFMSYKPYILFIGENGVSSTINPDNIDEWKEINF